MSGTTQEYKLCGRCKQVKDISLYNREAKAKGGYAHWCRGCFGRYNATYKRPDKPRPTYEQNRERRLRVRFGITIGQYNEMLAKQNFGCAVCGVGTNLKHKSFDVDHCHATGKVRGLLCRNCNTALGQLKESTRLLLRAVDYLEQL